MKEKYDVYFAVRTREEKKQNVRTVFFVVGEYLPSMSLLAV